MKTRTYLFWAIVTLFIAIIGPMFLTSSGPFRDKEALAPLTAEQQQIFNDLQTLSRGDIVYDPSGSLRGSETNYYMVRMTMRGADPKDSVYEFAPINGLGDIGMTHVYYTHELLKANVVRIALKTDKWTQVLGLYMGPNSGPNSPSK
jgi:hypothetical protein